MQVNDENAGGAVTVRKGPGGRGGGGNDGKQSALPAFLSLLFPPQPDCDHAELHMSTCDLKGSAAPKAGRPLGVFSRTELNVT